MKAKFCIGFIALRALAYTPTQTDLQVALASADKVWNLHADVSAIRFERLNDCRPTDAAAYSEFSHRVILVNDACRWTPELLRAAVLHEYGHMLMGSAEHDNNPRSIMHSVLRKGGKVLPDNREAARLAIEYRAVRPSILIGGLE